MVFWIIARITALSSTISTLTAMEHLLLRA
jgi:hypothetical protein